MSAKPALRSLAQLFASKLVGPACEKAVLISHVVKGLLFGLILYLLLIDDRN